MHLLLMISGHISSFGSECVLLAYLPRQWKSSQYRHEVRLSTFPDVMDNRKMRTAERRGRASGKETDPFRLVLFVFAPLVRLRRSSYTRRVPLSEAQHNVGRKSPLESHRRRTLIILLFCVPVPTHVRSHSIFVRPSRIRGKN